ncbi:MAG: hypothetical protein U1F68_20625 [Gammaproteobacteria bacterium]
MRTLYRFLLEACGFAAGFTIALLALAVSVDVLIRNLGWGNMPWLIECRNTRCTRSLSWRALGVAPPCPCARG